MQVINNFLSQCLALDTETTGNNPKVANIIEFGYAMHSPVGWEHYGELHYTEDKIDPTVSAKINITNRMLAGKPRFSEAIDTYQDIIDEYASGYLVAHNNSFDEEVLRRSGIDFRKIPWICTLRLSRKIFAEDKDVKSHTLDYLRYYLEVPLDESIASHRAGNDALITGHVLHGLVMLMAERKIINVTQPLGPQVHTYTWAPTVYTTMPFGKYQHQLLEDVPMDYWKWAFDKMDAFNETHEAYNKDLTLSVVAMLEKKLG